MRPPRIRPEIECALNQRSERSPHHASDDPSAARVAARNAKANEPRLFGVRAWDSHRRLNRGQRFTRTAMDIVMPLIDDALAAWNQKCEAG